MLCLLLHWILNALALLIVSHFVEGFEVRNVVSAFIAVVVIGLLNATVGLFLKIITLPLGILSFGLFFLVINAVILLFSSKLVPGFAVTTFGAGVPWSAGAGRAAFVVWVFRESGEDTVLAGCVGLSEGMRGGVLSRCFFVLRSAVR